MSSLSLYLHIPFCRQRCSYCDFNTYTSLSDLRVPYAQALAREITQVAGSAHRPAHTIFLGGGTPSLLAPEWLALIFQAVRDGFELAPEAEISLEANPGTVDADYLAALRALGVNRLSFGVQSADAGELALLGREHDFAAVVEAVAQARAAGFDNFNLDLIYGVPGQSLSTWERTLEAALALQPPHLSLYCLTIESGTPMHRWLNAGQIAAPDPDLAADQYDLACERLAQAGLAHYEISNWARPGHACQHNLTYWRNGEYLGLGAGAHGHAAGVRYHVVRQPRVYLRRLSDVAESSYPWSSARAGHTVLTYHDQIADTMITQLRLLEEGVDIGRFTQQFSQTPAAYYGDTLQRLQAWELLTEVDGSLRLTRRGWFLSNQVFHHLV